jgi:hypothetical protein
MKAHKRRAVRLDKHTQHKGVAYLRRRKHGLSHALLLSPGLPLALCQRCPDGSSHSDVRLGWLVERGHVLSATLEEQITGTSTASSKARHTHSHSHTHAAPNTRREKERGESERGPKSGSTLVEGAYDRPFARMVQDHLKDVQLFNIVSMMICLGDTGVVRI